MFEGWFKLTFELFLVPEENKFEHKIFLSDALFKKLVNYPQSAYRNFAAHFFLPNKPLLFHLAIEEHSHIRLTANRIADKSSHTTTHSRMATALIDTLKWIVHTWTGTGHRAKQVPRTTHVPSDLLHINSQQDNVG